MGLISPGGQNLLDFLELRQVLSTYDGALRVSLYEGLPNVICEAMTIGRPVMMTPVSDHDVLIGAQNGFLCTDTDARSIAEALTAFLQTDRDTLLQMGKMSATKANDLFASDVVLAQWMQVCRKENAK